MTATARTLLQLMWLASPALPVGGFSYSEGLEAAVEAGLVQDEHSAARWLQDQLHLVLVRSEWPAVSRAYAALQVRDAPGVPVAGTDQVKQGDQAGEVSGSAQAPHAGEAVQAVNDWVLHTRESRELRLQAEQMGRSLADWLVQRYPEDARAVSLRALSPAPTWPVAFALAGVSSGASLKDTLLAHGFGWAENQVQAAIKCIPLGQSAGQRVLQQLADALPEAVERSHAGSQGHAQSYTPGLAIFSARHEQQYSRLFRS